LGVRVKGAARPEGALVLARVALRRRGSNRLVCLAAFGHAIRVLDLFVTAIL
jgi:hypothetical protein